MDIKDIVKRMTLEEKAKLCSGADEWKTESLDKFGIPQAMLCDGPHGLRKRAITDGAKSYNTTVKATCFPSGAGLASSWDRELVAGAGKTIAKEARAEGVAVLLGPAINMKRSPLCGRNFEYYSEDPFLAGELAASFVNAVQAEGVGTSAKHFAVNNQETRRHSTSANLSMRALREIYLAAFEIVVKKSQPATIMHSYNRINGTNASNSAWLLNDILREEWGYEGFVMSDWNAMYERAGSLEAGCELEMPASAGVRDRDIIDAVRSGRLDEKILDRAVLRILNVLLKYIPKGPGESVNLDNHHKIAAEVASECMVLLKNEKNLLPFADGRPLAVIGAFAKTPRYQGGGSSHVNSYRVDNVFDFIAERNAAETLYAAGYSLDNDTVDENLINEAVETAKKCGRALIFAGMPDSYESEGYDRRHMRMPASHNALISAVCAAVPDSAVVLLAGSPVEMPWLKDANALLHAYLGGQALGGAITALVFGDKNPCGRLAETMPVKLEDNPSYLNFPGDGNECNYAEDIYIGYRWYDTRKAAVNFPFGYGLSYTGFEYSELDITDNTVSLTVTNIGSRAGKEVVQLYVGAANPEISRPLKELKGFIKIYLEAGESKRVTFELDERSFAFWDSRFSKWRVPTGDYIIYVGRSVSDIALKATVHKTEKCRPFLPLDKVTTVGDLMTDEAYAPVVKELLLKLLPKDRADALRADNGYTAEKSILGRYRYHTLRMFIGSGSEPLTEEKLRIYIDEANEKLKQSAGN